MTHWIWDIETIPLPDLELQALMPDEIREPRMPEELEKPEMPVFEHKSLKDPEKIAEWHATKVGEWRGEIRAKIAKWRDATMEAQLKFIDRAPLSAVTGSIALIGMFEIGTADKYIYAASADASVLRTNGRQGMIMCCGNEEQLLRQFWGRIEHLRNTGDIQLIGAHSNRFDLPFVKRRSWIHRVPIPVPTMSGAYVDRSLWVDVHDLWQSGDREERISVDNMARALGVKRKTGSGETFWRLWRDDKQAAVRYLCDDLETTAQIAVAMGVGR